MHVVTRKGLEAKKALTGIFNDRFGGMMERQSKTLTGMISNLKDSWSNFLMMVADAGIFDLVKGKIGALLAKVNLLAKDGSLKKWAKNISDWLEKAFKWGTDFIEQTNWKQVGADLRAVASAVMAVASAINWLVQLGPKASNALKFMSPGALAWALPLLGNSAASLGASLVTGKSAAPGKKQTPAPRAQWPTGPARAPSRYLSKTAANDTRVGGAVRIILEARDGTAARVASISSDNRNVPVSVQVGRTIPLA